MSRLSFVHSLQRQWREANLKFIPSLFTTKEGDSFAKSALGFWELAEWMPGEPPDPGAISPPQLDAVVAALAAIHNATRSTATLDTSPGLGQRLEMLTRWQATDFAQIERQIEQVGWPEFAARARETLALFPHLASPIRDELSAAAKAPLPLQECLRDIHSDHIFLTGAFVTGVIDFGAVRRESCAGDLARLCGSLFENDRTGWDDFLTRYERHRPLLPAERRAIATFDRSAALLTGLQWIEWIAVEKRSFPQPEVVLNRLDISLRRMRFLLK
ncbi:phosphotransferase [Blastopirellula retiformator]|nr:phosphotransferase [Blastopirellula retiformator]